MRTVLITGGYGFLGRAAARRFKSGGYRVIGIGRGRWATEEAQAAGFDTWLDAGISVSSLMTFSQPFDVVVHCGGNGSVGYSVSNPLQDFFKTVQGTAELIDYLRLKKSEALVIYPSSAGVYGSKPDSPIHESDSLNPISAYGYHKRMAEHLLELHARTSGIRAAVIRFFSVYGSGLTKQLLWDASSKLLGQASPDATQFWGTGEETRDWIDSRDAAELIFAVSQSTEQHVVLNGANGVRVTVLQILEMLRDALGSRAPIRFNGVVREGDPLFYHADVGRAHSIGWVPSIDLADGIRAYADWIRERR